MIKILEKLGDYYFHWVEIWYHFLHRVGLFLLMGPCLLAQENPSNQPDIRLVAQGLSVPWDMEWLGDDAIIFTQIDGDISKVDLRNGKVKILYHFGDVARELQSGLLGLALHPHFTKQPYVYAAYTSYKGDVLVLRIARLEYSPAKEQLIFSKIIVDNIPSAPTDIGGRLLIAPDETIYLSVGDNEQSERAQDLLSPNGKILRYNLDGSIPHDNPFPGSPVYAIGIRNSQGLAVSPPSPATSHQPPIYFTEHGTMSDDELNLLEPGANYGWQLVAGPCDDEPKTVCEKIKHQEPMKAWTPTVAPAGLAFYGSDRYRSLNNSLLIANLFDQSLKCVFLDKNGNQTTGEQDFIREEIGRMRDVLVSPEGRVFVCTSNADKYGAAPKGSDGIYEVDFSKTGTHVADAGVATLEELSALQPASELKLDSTTLEIRVLAHGLIHPWDMAWGFDNRIWFTENGGYIKRLDPVSGAVDTLLHLDDCHSSWGNPGIYSLGFNPDFPKEPYLFVHYTNSATNSKLVRFRYDFDHDALTDSVSILPVIKANESHNGSRIVFTPDRKMFFAMGEAYTPELAQDLNSINGKILRLNLDGTVPDDNPFPGSLIWSYGHRNPQGLALLPNSTLWSSEHGPNNDDELNLIVKGGNYGWPNVQGFCDLRSERRFCEKNHVMEPVIAWTPTVAPCALEYYNHPAIPEWGNSLMQVFLKKGKGNLGQRMTVFKLSQEGNQILSSEDYFVKTFGRLRDVLVAPDGRVFICTSNKEVSGNGKKVVQESDDKIIELRAKR